MQFALPVAVAVVVDGREEALFELVRALNNVPRVLLISYHRRPRRASTVQCSRLITNAAAGALLPSGHEGVGVMLYRHAVKRQSNKHDTVAC